MKKQLRLLPLVVLIAGAIVLVLRFGHSDEPSYQGRRLGEWLDDYHHTPSGKTNCAAIAAVQAIGTNGFPYLLHHVTNRPSALSALYWRCYETVNTLLVDCLHWRSEYLRGRPHHGMDGFRILGKSASNAI